MQCECMVIGANGELQRVPNELDSLRTALSAAEAKLEVAREALQKIQDEAVDLIEQVQGKHEPGCDSYWTCNLCHADGSGILVREWAREALTKLEKKP